jgi:hypothetical protein
LEGLHNLNPIYQEIKDGTWNFVNLWKSVKAAGMGVPHVNRLLTTANNDLPAVELRYEGLKKEAATLEFQNASSARDSELLNNQISHHFSIVSLSIKSYVQPLIDLYF